MIEFFKNSLINLGTIFSSGSIARFLMPEKLEWFSVVIWGILFLCFIHVFYMVFYFGFYGTFDE